MLIKLTDVSYVDPALVTSVSAQPANGATWLVSVVCAGETIQVEEAETYEQATVGVAAIVDAIQQQNGGTP